MAQANEQVYQRAHQDPDCRGMGTTLVAALVEGNVARLSIDLPVPEHAMAERMARRWPECAGKVYQQLLKALCEENE